MTPQWVEEEDKDLWKHAAEKNTFLKVLFVNSVATILLEVVMGLCAHKEMGSTTFKWFGFRK